MPTSRNKELVHEFWKYFAIDTGRALSMVSEDAVWKLGQANGGDFDKPTISKVLDAVISQFASPAVFTMGSMTAEDNRVCVEIQGAAELTNGKRYDNKYCMVFTIHDGKITRVHEYTDTFYALNTLSVEGFKDHLAA